MVQIEEFSYMEVSMIRSLIVLFVAAWTLVPAAADQFGSVVTAHVIAINHMRYNERSPHGYERRYNRNKPWERYGDRWTPRPSVRYERPRIYMRAFECRGTNYWRMRNRCPLGGYQYYPSIR